MWYVWALHVATFLLVTFHALRRRKEASSTILWIFVAWSFPAVGPLLYLSFGVDRVPYKAFRKRITDQRLVQERKAREDEELPLAYWRTVHESGTAEPSSALARELNRSLRSVLPDHPLLGGNSISPLVDGDEAFPAMMDAIASAKHHIHIQSFIIGRDATGREFMEALRRKAEAGVVVRLMFDRFGSTHAFLSGMFARYRRTPNFRIAGWTQANPLKRQFQINLRNHRKVMIVDGTRAFTGGINIHDRSRTFDGIPSIRDYHFALSGPVVQELQFTFMRDWYFTTDENPGNLLQEVYFPPIRPAGNALVRMVNDGPDMEGREPISDTFFLALGLARRQILAVTPYFVPPNDILQAFRAAALRGVDVRLVVPLHNNHFYAGLAGCALYDELLYAGVRIYERRPPFMHAKALIVDDEIAFVGTANLDFRSLRLNYETNLLVFDNPFLGQLKRIVLEDIAMSSELTLQSWRARPQWRKVTENLAFLMTPIL